MLRARRRRTARSAHPASFEPLESRLLLSANPQVMISEIMYYPGFGEPGASGYIAEDPRLEYIELYNRGPTDMSLAGWQFTQGVSFTFPSITIPSGGYLVVAADLAAFQAKYPTVTNAIGGWTGKLANSGNDVELEDALAQRVDFVSYSNEGDWALRRIGDVYPGQPGWWRGWKWTSAADAGAKSLELINPAVSNDYGQNWAPSIPDGGTPGAANSVASGDTAPIIVDVKNYPYIPKSSDPVTITAQVIDELTTGLTVSLYHRVDGAPGFTVDTMYDDGLHGDGIANDGVYGVVLPAQPDRTVVEFYVKATDSGAHARAWPGPTDDVGTQGANALYQVDNSVYTGPQPVYHLITTASEWTTWTSLMGGTGRWSNAQMNGTLVTVDGTGAELRYEVGIRNRGAGTRTANPHNLQVNIPNDHPLNGLTRFELNTRTVESQVAGNVVFQEADLLGPYGGAVQVRINGVNRANLTPTGGVDTYQYGSYYLFEPYDSEWAANHIPNDSQGNLYKGVWYIDGQSLSHPANFADYGTNINNYRYRYDPTGPNAGTSGGYSKQTNTAEDDWTDLVHLVNVLNATYATDADYAAAVSQIVDVDQWLRHFAVTSLMGNMETTIATGTGDDYSMYRGLVDGRWQLLPHDLDTVLGRGDVTADYGRLIFYAARDTNNAPAIRRFLKNSVFAPRYYAALKDLLDTEFQTDHMNALLDHLFGNWSTDSTIQGAMNTALASMKSFVVQRDAAVLTQIPLTISNIVGPAAQNGYSHTTSSTATITGNANAIKTRTVLVNGVQVTWSAWEAKFTASSVALRPGINRLLIQAMDENGNEIERTTFDVWYDTGAMTNVSGTLPAGTTTWTPSGGPYHVTASITVPAGSVLVIQPGTTVFFEPGTGITVSGRLDAQGTDTARIFMTRTPTVSTNWAGINLNYASYSAEVNRITYAAIEYGDSTSHAVKTQDAQVVIDHVAFGHHGTQYLTIDDSSAIVTNSVFPDITNAELVHFWGFPATGYARFEGNWFGKTTGYNDTIDFTGGNRPGPIAQFLNNTFTGGNDDGIDLDGTDAHVEGNVFMHYHQESARESQSHAVTTGTDLGEVSQVTIVRNLFYDMDHAILIKDGGFCTIVNNTFVNIHKTISGSTEAAVNLYEARSGQWQGDGAYLDGNIFYDVVQLFQNPDWAGHPVTITMNNSIFPVTGEAIHWTGTGNLNLDPRLVNTTSVTDPRTDFALRPGSPAIGAGPNGRDMGGVVPAGASISGEPVGTTWLTSATLTVGGPDIYAYKYRVNDGPWSGPMGVMKTVSSITRSGSIATATVTGHGYANGDVVDIYGSSAGEYDGAFTISNVTANTFDFTVSGTPTTPAPGTINVKRREPIRLTGLANGTYHVDVIEQNSASQWRSESAPTASKTWTVNTSLAPHVRINEVLADNVAAEPHNGTPGPATYFDVIELYNDGQGTIDLSGMSLTDNPALPGKFTFAPGTTLGQGEYLVLYGGTDLVTPENHLGFSLKADGDDLYLYSSAGNGGGLVDSVAFGLQIPDFSIGRRTDGTWGLSTPTFGSANVAVRTGEQSKLRINEWLADEKAAFADDFIELYNTDPLPVDMAGLYLSDNPAGWWNRHQIASLSFIVGNTTGYGGYAWFHADADLAAGPDHLGFKLSPFPGMISLSSASRSLIDQISYAFQSTDVSEGRTPLAAWQFAFEAIPTRGIENTGITRGSSGSVITTRLIDLTALDADKWRYDQSGVPLGTTWKDTAFVDSGWLLGSPEFYYRYTPDTLPVPIRTTLAGNPANLDGSGHPRPYNTYYFRRHFNFSGDISQTTLELKTVLDDGAVVYLNGNEAERLAINDGITVIFSTSSNRTVGIAAWETWTIPTTYLVQGDNVIAVEVHQCNTGSSDIAWGSTLDAKVGGQGQVILRQVDVPANIAALMNQLRITEVMYDPPGGGSYEYIELQNTGATTLDLTGVRLTGGVDYTFTGGALTAGQYVLVVADTVAFASRYGGGLNVAGQYAGRLSNAGDSIALQLPEPYDAAMLRFDYSPTWYPLTSGGGYSLVIVAPTGLRASWQDKPAWRASVHAGGSPGAADTGQLPGSIVISEIMSHTDVDPPGDWIELYNTTNDPIDISGWYLSDDLADLRKYKVQPNTVLGSHEYVVFTQFDNFGFDDRPGALVPFAFSELGDDAYLSSSNPDGSLGDYRESVVFGAAEREVTFGRYTRSTGDTVFVRQSDATREMTNAGPKVGPIVINELMYNPPTGGDEYIELRNISDADVPLYDPLYPVNTWMFSDGVTFSFPQGASMPAGSYALVVKLDPTTFRSKYGIPSYIQVFGSYVGSLDNAGENVAISMSHTQPDATVAYVLIDAVRYDEKAPWPIAADGSGPSLSRLVSANFGDDVINWAAESPTGSAGYRNFDATVPTSDIVDVSPDPRNTPVGSVTITFTRPVKDFDVSDLTLTRDGGGVSLAGATLTTVNGTAWALGNLAGATAAGGSYVLTLSISDIKDLANHPLTAGASDSFVIDLTPPAVTRVLVSGTAWGGNFLNYLRDNGLGDGGYAVPVGSGVQLKPLPWNNINQVKVVFSENVLVDSTDMLLSGSNVPTYAVGGFSYDAVTFTATWTLSAPIAADKVRLELNADGTDPIRDGTSNTLDGEWTNPTSTSTPSSSVFPSGNGAAGGNFDFRFNVLPGDVNQNGVVQSNDGLTVRAALGTSTSTGGLYSVFKDINANGVIQSNDGLAVRNKLGSTLPSDEPGSGMGGMSAPLSEAGGLTQSGSAPSLMTSPTVSPLSGSAASGTSTSAPTSSLSGSGAFDVLAAAAPVDGSSTPATSAAAPTQNEDLWYNQNGKRKSPSLLQSPI